jgi:hypothetical protein
MKRGIGENFPKSFSLPAGYYTVFFSPDEEKRRMEFSPEGRKFKGGSIVDQAQEAAGGTGKLKGFTVSFKFFSGYLSTVGYLK